MPTKVSVVVPVYNPGPHLDPLVSSLHRQTMSPEEFEVVFVDDGSTDGTGQRLEALAAAHPNYQVVHIPNSGWPGLPRNIGIEASRGEYVMFVDNDDALGHQALQRLCDYAADHDSDIVVGKEVRKNTYRHLVPLFTKNRPRATLAHDPLLSYLTPHKMFRREFLDQNGLRFPEGPRRLEDHPFVVKAYFAADVVSVLSDYPCYFWVTRPDKSNAGLRPRHWAEWYAHMRDVLDVVAEHTEPGPFRDRLLAHWYTSKGLSLLGGGLAGRDPEDADRLLRALRDLALERFPSGVDVFLTGIQRVRSMLLRAGEFDRILDLARAERGMHLEHRLDGVQIVDGKLEIRATGWLCYADGSPVLLTEHQGRLRWEPPVQLTDLLSVDDLDFTDDAQRAKVEVVLRNRRSYELCGLPGSSTPLPPGPAGERYLGVTRTARLDPETALVGGPLHREVWDADLQLGGVGWPMRRALTGPEEPARHPTLTPPLATGRLVVPYTTRRGTLAVDVDQRAVSVFTAAPPDLGAARLRSEPGGVRLRIPLRGLRLENGQRFAGRMRLRCTGRDDVEVRCRLTPGPDGRGRLVASIPVARTGGWSAADGEPVDGPVALGAGRWRMRVTLRRRTTRLGPVLEVEPGGAVSLMAAGDTRVAHARAGSRYAVGRRRRARSQR